jgi:hypothetical protein
MKWDLPKQQGKKSCECAWLKECLEQTDRFLVPLLRVLEPMDLQSLHIMSSLGSVFQGT